MIVTDDPDELNPRPWSDLPKRERREVLVPDLLLSIGVTTLAAQSGDGKTSIAMAIKHALETGMWGATPIKKRPVVWVIGEDIDDLQPMYEANRQHLKLPPSPSPAGFYLDDPVDLSDEKGTKKFIKLLEKTPQPLIVLDALADIIGDLDESSAKDMNRVYRNIWHVVRATGASVLVPHHAGWVERRERGSSVIRAKSDIVALIVDFDPVSGTVKLMHKKRRGGRKLPEFFLGVKLVQVAGYQEPIPVVTGPMSEQDLVPGEVVAETQRHARELVNVVVQYFPEGATNAELRKQSGMKDSTFDRALTCAHRDKAWLIGGGGRGKRYNLNPDGCWTTSPSVSPPTTSPSPSPYKGVKVIGGDKVVTTGVSWRRVGGDGDTANCKNGHATASAGNFNENNEGEELDLVAEVLRHVADKKSRFSR